MLSSFQLGAIVQISMEPPSWSRGPMRYRGVLVKGYCRKPDGARYER